MILSAEKLLGSHILMCLSLLGLLASPAAFTQTPSQEFYDLPQIVAVQNRPYYLNQDLTFHFGTLPLDAFNKGYPIGWTYTHFFRDYLAWEVINLNYSFNDETKLKRALVEDFSVEIRNVGFEGVLDFPRWYALSSLVYTPMYMKNLLFNRSLVHGEVSFVGGLGAAKFAETGYRPLISVGAYIRLFSSERASWKVDLRNNIHIDETVGAVNMLSIMLGYSYQLGGRPEGNSP